MTKQPTTWRPKPRRRSSFYARIDLTALRGVWLVIFVLLCMFPGPNHAWHGRFSNSLPVVAYARAHPSALRDDAVQIGIWRRGDIFVFGNRNHQSTERVAARDLASLLDSLLLPDVERRVYVTADSGTKYRDVQAALAGVRDAGISDITFLVDERSSGQDPIDR